MILLNRKEQLSREIEALRIRLNKLVKEKGDLADPQIIQLSHELDAKIVEYQKFIRSPSTTD